jgi:hypothetical protein
MSEIRNKLWGYIPPWSPSKRKSFLETRGPSMIMGKWRYQLFYCSRSVISTNSGHVSSLIHSKSIQHRDSNTWRCVRTNFRNCWGQRSCFARRRLSSGDRWGRWGLKRLRSLKVTFCHHLDFWSYYQNKYRNISADSDMKHQPLQPIDKGWDMTEIALDLLGISSRRSDSCGSWTFNSRNQRWTFERPVQVDVLIVTKYFKL